MEFLSGFESTYIVGSGKDVLDLTDHVGRVRSDLELVRDLGVRTLRFSFPWHKIERVRGQYDFAWMDEAVDIARELGIELIADLLHHTSFPDWLTYGFTDGRFVPRFVEFSRVVAARYPHVARYTVVNEPYVTCWFCGHEGIWHPHGSTDAIFADMMIQAATANALAQRAIERERGPVEFLHTESCEQHFAADRESIPHAQWSNQMRFAGHDLLLGAVDHEHPLWRYFSDDRRNDEGLDALVRQPGRIDVLGLDYYNHNELWWSRDGRIEPPERRGFADVATDYLDRYGLDAMLSETNIRGTPMDRVAHLSMMVWECEKLRRRAVNRGLNFRGFCYYPFIDCRGWSNLCTRVTHNLDPQGIVSLDDDNERVQTEFTRAFDDLALSGNLVEYPFLDDHETLRPARPHHPAQGGRPHRGGRRPL